MSTSLIGFAIALVVAAVIVFPLGNVLRTKSWVFYLVAAVLVGLYMWAVLTGANLTAWRKVTIILQKGYLSTILLAVVMFTGCFDEGTAIRKKLQPIRGELSILSFIFIIGHLTMYLPSYLSRITKIFGARVDLAISFVVALILMVLFIALGVTSFKFIRKHMNPHGWKILQRFSYVMVALLAVHVGFVMGKSAFASSFSLSTVAFWSYLVVIAIYAALRIRKAVRDSRKHAVGAVASTQEEHPVSPSE